MSENALLEIIQCIKDHPFPNEGKIYEKVDEIIEKLGIYTCPICHQLKIKEQYDWVINHLTEKTYNICINCQNTNWEQCKKWVKTQEVKKDRK